MASQVFDLRDHSNLWHAPDIVTCFGVWLVGPPEHEWERMKREVERRRRQWEPTAEANDQLREILDAVEGKRIVIWNDDPGIVVAIGEENGPFPIEALCHAVEIRHDETGTLQAYLLLEDPLCIENRWGYDGRETYFVPAKKPNQFWVNLATIYQIAVP